MTKNRSRIRLSEIRTVLHPILLMGLLFATACLRIEDQDHQPASEQRPPSAPVEVSLPSPKQVNAPSLAAPPPQPVYANLRAGSDLFEYEVLINPPTNATHFQKRRIEVSQSSSVLPFTQLSWVDKDIESGGQYEYIFFSEGGVIVARTAVSIPLDIDIQGTVSADSMNLDSRKKYGRVLFREGARLVTNGTDYDLHGDLLISQNAEIVTFESGSTAPQGEVGKSGGRISLSFKKAEGQLRVTLHGQAGGQGRPGEQRMDRPPQSNEAATASQAGYRDNSSECYRQGQQGGMGAPGYVGLPGSDGLPGGDAGELKTHFQENLLELSVFSHAGEGGGGGAGGCGGYGGLGGAAAPTVFITYHGPNQTKGVRDEEKPYFETLCQFQGLAGAEGPRGPTGLPGSPGRKGSSGTYCWNENDIEKCQVLLDQ